MVYIVVGALVIGACLGLLGSGGSILTVPVLVFLLHHPDKVAIAESLAIVGGIALLNGVSYARRKLVDWRSVVLFGIPGLVGAFVGSRFLGRLVSGEVQLLVFAGVMLAASGMMWRSAGRAGEGGEDQRGARRHPAKVMLDGVLIGLMTGFVGVGGGFLIVPALALLSKLPMRVAIGTSLFIITINSAAGFGGNSEHFAEMNWAGMGLFVAIGFFGGLIGKHLNARLDQRTLRRAFGVFLVIMAVFIIAKRLPPLLERSGVEPAPAAGVDDGGDS